MLCRPQGLPWEPTLVCRVENATAGEHGEAQKRSELVPVSVEVDVTTGSIIPVLTPRKQPSIPGPPWPQKEARHEVSGAVDLLSCAALQPSEVLTHSYHRPRDSLPFYHPLAWEETGGINIPPTPFSCCLAPSFGVCGTAAPQAVPWRGRSSPGELLRAGVGQF